MDNLGQGIKILRESIGLTQRQLAKDASLSQAGLSSIESGNSSPSIATLEAIAAALNYSLPGLLVEVGVYDGYIPEQFNGDIDAYIAFQNAVEEDAASEVEPSYTEGELIKKYRFIDQPARDVVDVVLNFEYERAQSTPSSVISATAVNEATVELPVLASTAAGVPVELLGDLLSGEVERVAVPASVGADFCLRVSGDSMEPDIPNGSIIALKSQNDAYNGDYAVFYMNNELTCKIYCKEDTHIELRSVNEAYAPLTIESETEVRIVGRVMPVQDRWYVKQ